MEDVFSKMTGRGGDAVGEGQGGACLRRTPLEARRSLPEAFHRRSISMREGEKEVWMASSRLRAAPHSEGRTDGEGREEREGSLSCADRVADRRKGSGRG